MYSPSTQFGEQPLSSKKMLAAEMREQSPTVFRHQMDLAQLYPNEPDRLAFEERWETFLNAVGDEKDVFEKKGDTLAYLTERLSSPSNGGRRPVLLLLGNPATHSVRAGVFFTSERGGLEHRFWKGLRRTGWLSSPDEQISDNEKKNEARRSQLLSGDYESPFRISLDVFFTFPTPASGRPWSGVAGLKRLFGRGVVAAIADEERTRLARIIAELAAEDGAIVAFQRDAYERIGGEEANPYSRSLALRGELISNKAAGQQVKLLGAPPTYCALWPGFRTALRRYRQFI